MVQLALRKALKGQGMLQTIANTSGANLLIILLSTLTSILTARMFGVEGRGALAAILFWPVFLSGLVSFGLPTSMIFNLKSNRGRSAEYIRAAGLFQIPVSLIAGSVAWVYLPHWLNNFPPEVSQIAKWYTAATIPLALLIGLVSAIAQSTEKFNVYNGIRLLIPLFNLLGLMLLWGIGVLNIGLASAVNLLSSILLMMWALYCIRKELKLNWLKSSMDWTAVKHLFRYGGKVFGVELLGTLYSQIDKIIILAMLTPRDFGLYAVVYALSRIYNAVQNAITNVIFPKITGLPQDQIISLVGRAFRLSLLLMIIIVFPTMFIGRFFIGVLYGEAFLGASSAFYLLSFECIIGGGSWILATSFNALGRPGLVLVRQVIALSATIGLLFLFTPLWGINGIALALLAGAGIRMFITLIAMRVVFHVRLNAMLFNKEDFVFLFNRLGKNGKSFIKGEKGNAKE